MELYANLGRDSSVVGYSFGAGWIIVQFQDGKRYRYTDASAGASNILTMQRLARAGQGLCSFIHAHVKYDYESKS